MDEVKSQLNRAAVIDANFKKSVLAQEKSTQNTGVLNPSDAGLSKEAWLDLVESQFISRHLDLYARVLKDKNLGFYTIGSSGHEGNAGIAYVLNLKDMAFLHYRSGAFMIQRAKQGIKEGIKTNPIRDHLLSLMASKFDPISAGRHKVFGHPLLNVPPQTSTIASHLPKALGAAFGLNFISKQHEQTQHESKQHELKQHELKSIVCCSFGDASFNHSTLQGTLNAVSRLRYGQHPIPLLMVCEDNGIGISVATPKGWIQAAMKERPGITYLHCDGRNLVDVIFKTQQAQTLVRKGEPVFLHFETVRLMGHAGSDIEQQYLTSPQILEQEAGDPLLHSTQITLDAGWKTQEDMVNWYEQIRSKVESEFKSIVAQGLDKGLTSKDEIMSSVVPDKRASSKKEQTVLQSDLNSESKNLAQNINKALAEILEDYPKAYLFGEDVAKKGGVYQVTAGLQSKFGHRVMDSILDEQTILGMAIGFGQLGLLPIVEIQFLAYLQNAIDQLRGEAATLSFFSNKQFSNPMVIRLPGLAYQKGFGGHFHNENAIGCLREIPGVIVCCPSNGHDAVCLLRECIRLADEEQRVVVFIEPIALYMTKDLYTPGDMAWLKPYPKQKALLHYGQLGIHTDFVKLKESNDKYSLKVKGKEERKEEEKGRKEVLIVSYANGFYLSLKAAKKLHETQGFNITVVDLRWLCPLPKQELLALITSKSFSHILLVDECRQTGSLSEEIFTFLMEAEVTAPLARVTAADCFIPLGNAWQYILPSVDEIIETLNCLIKR